MMILRQIRELRIVRLGKLRTKMSTDNCEFCGFELGRYEPYIPALKVGGVFVPLCTRCASVAEQSEDGKT